MGAAAMKCAHFEREGLARQEAGLPDPHVDTCADCQAARATYRRMTDALAGVGAELRPRAGWEDAVLAKVRAPAPRRRGLYAAVGVALMAAAIALVVLRRPERPREVASIDRVQSGTIVRGGGETWTAGDAIWAVSGRAGAVWIYRDRALVSTCDLASIAPPACVRHGDGVRAWLPTRYGAYHVFALQAPPPAAAPPTLDAAKALLSRGPASASDLRFDVR